MNESESVTHLHLDPLGGMAGDMFVAAMLDAFPELETRTTQAAAALSGVPCRKVVHRDAVLTGARFDVQDHRSHHHPHPHHDDHLHDDHAHTAWREIERTIERSGLPAAVKQHAVAIFAQLADAEAAVHGIPVADVTFHEVGAADSIADIVAAASVIAAFPRATWSVAPLPLGSGRVSTAHGMLPVPAPATVRLLQGLPTVDDGIAGERVTPTGAAILRHLAPIPRQGRMGGIARTGIGFGTKVLPGMSNIVRVIAFSGAGAAATGQHRELMVIGFEVDDQSPEDLALGLDRLRALQGVHDVLQMPAFGKKGRMTVHVQVLAHPDAADAAVEACFRETTTIGLRIHQVEGRALPRRLHEVEVGGARLRVKSVDRPGGRTSKAEADDVLSHEGHATRARLRRTAETLAEDADA